MRETRMKGKFTGGRVNYGYCCHEQKLSVIEEEAAVLLEIFTDYANGKSLTDIANGLNSRGITNRGKPFLMNSILRLCILFLTGRSVFILHNRSPFVFLIGLAFSDPRDYRGVFVIQKKRLRQNKSATSSFIFFLHRAGYLFLRPYLPYPLFVSYPNRSVRLFRC